MVYAIVIIVIVLIAMTVIWIAARKKKQSPVWTNGWALQGGEGFR